VKPTLNPRFFQYFTSKNKPQGMSTVDWLAVILLGAIATVILLYLFSSRSKHSHSVEARNIIGAMNRSQQAYYLEKENFTDGIPELGLGITNPTKHYQYSIEKFPLMVFHYGVPRQRHLKSYIGVVLLLSTEDPAPNNIITKTLLCESQDPEVKPFEPIVENGAIECSPSLKDIGNPEGIFVGEEWEQAHRALQLAAMGKSDAALKLAESIKNQFYQQRVLEQIRLNSSP
jgi:type IV pilus assembly protein PilA